MWRRSRFKSRHRHRVVATLLARESVAYDPVFVRHVLMAAKQPMTFCDEEDDLYRLLVKDGSKEKMN